MPVALGVSSVPTTFAGRAQQRTHFLKNTAILGGLLLVALD